MASMRDIKRRRESIQSTQQITKAMKLVSTVKLQRAKTRAENAKPYFTKMEETVKSILSRSEGISHPYLENNGSDRKALVVVTANRGLAGGYNNNVVKQILETGWDKDKTLIYGIGKKGIEALSRRGYPIAADESDMINEPLFSDAAQIGQMVLDAYAAGEVGEIWIAYTMFKNTVVHIPMLEKLLPVEAGEAAGNESGEEGGAENGGPTVAKAGPQAPMNYEPEAEEALNIIIPTYINSIIYGAFIEAVASENGARMQAMDNATSNAEEMIANLSLAYNRARQGAITQELTEIISGAEALN
jgi:F-type H+-transporting ATPase subunit gamma